MVCLGLEPGAPGWWMQTSPLIGSFFREYLKGRWKPSLVETGFWRATLWRVLWSWEGFSKIIDRAQQNKSSWVSLAIWERSKLFRNGNNLAYLLLNKCDRPRVPLKPSRLLTKNNDSFNVIWLCIDQTSCNSLVKVFMVGHCRTTTYLSLTLGRRWALTNSRTFVASFN